MKQNRRFDVTLPFHHGLPVWPGDRLPEIRRTARMETGDLYNSSELSGSFHWGTHVDAPYHLNPDGWKIDEIPLDVLMGNATVVAMEDASQITADHLKDIDLKYTKRILFKTRNSKFWNEKPLQFHSDFTSLTPGAAEFLLEIGIELVGIDYFSIDLYAASELPVHNLLYEKNVVAIENLDLRAITPGEYRLYCLPLRVKDGDGSPARVILET